MGFFESVGNVIGSIGSFLAPAVAITLAIFAPEIGIPWIMAATFATSVVASRVFGSNQNQNNTTPTGNEGARIQVPPDTTNPIPVVYGDAYLGGKFVDGVLTTEQQVMFYVMAISCISENGQFSYDLANTYYGDRICTFYTGGPDPSDGARVLSLTDTAGNVDTTINGSLFMYLYISDKDGNITPVNSGYMPWEVMGPTPPGGGNIDPSQRWNPTGRRMNGLAFAIINLHYNQAANTTSLSPITFHVSHHLNDTGLALPGDVWYDYLTNPIYGGAVDPKYVDYDSANALNVYSNEVITFNDYEGNPQTQARYLINGVLDTSQSILNNIDQIMTACDSWNTYRAVSGKWYVTINKPSDISGYFDDNNIIGAITVGEIDIAQMPNQIQAKFPDKTNRDQSNYVVEVTPPELLYPNEPINKITLNYDLVNNSVQALYLANRTLEQNREDLLVTINTTYKGIEIEAGDVISITNGYYGWNYKLFRVMQVKESVNPDYTLGASLQCVEYNAAVYDNQDITQFHPASNSNLVSSAYFSPLTAPTIDDQQPNAAVPSFSVDCVLPATGRVTLINLYYTTVASPTTSDWQLLSTQTASNSQPFINGSTLKFTHISLPTNTYYFSFLVANDVSSSALSGSSIAYNWLPNPTTSAVAGTFIASFSPSVLQVPYDGTTAEFTGVIAQLYGTTAGGSVDFVASQSDSDSAFVNNTWRIGNSSTTGYGGIVKTGITIGNPTDGGNFAVFPAPTAMSSNPATISVPVRYKSATGTVTQGATATIQFTYAIKGDTGNAGNKNGIAYLYQWATSTPSNPSGTSIFTWSSGSNASYTGGGGWYTSVPANPGTPSILLYRASIAVVAPSTDVTTTINWASGYSISTISQNGANGTNGANGVQSANPTVYQWAVTLPTGPSGTSTYTWSSNTFSPTPSSWSLTPGTSPSAGYTLWGATVPLVDSATVSTSIINWTTASITARGYAGSNGTNGTNGTNGSPGASSRICYASTYSSSLNSTPTTYTTSGSSSFPPYNTWGGSETWQSTPPSIVAGQSVYQSDGIFDPTTGNTVWNVPYLSALKVGSLSAITANLGNVTAGTITAGMISGGSVGTYNGGTFSMGSSVVYDGFTGTETLAQFDNGKSCLVAFHGNSSGSDTQSTAGVFLNRALNSPAIVAVNLLSDFPFIPRSSTGIGYGSTGIVTTNFGASGGGQSTLIGAGYGYGAYTRAFGSSTQIQAEVFLATSGLAGSFSYYVTNTTTLSKQIQLATPSYCAYSGSGQGKIYIVDGNGPFTGFHEGLISNNTSVEIGDILFDVAPYKRDGISSVTFYVDVTNQNNQPAIIGVCSQIYTIPPSNWMTSKPILPAVVPDRNTIVEPTSEFVPESLVPEGYQVVNINALGEGQINVCGLGGNISKGDLIVASSISGKGMKQADDIIRSYTVAKAREDVIFDSPEDIKLVACVYVSG